MTAPFSQAPLVKKLALKPGSHMLVIAPPAGYRDLLGELPTGAEVAETSGTVDGTFDWIHLFVTTQAELERQLPAIKSRVAPGGVFWVSFPRAKSATDLNRTILMGLVPRFALDIVTNVAVNDDWTAYRLKPLAAR
ncbi:MAG TPA: hypothetical protein VIG30_04890 [Ktedonobacterales bacterium]|jgi:hypothetical protein